MKSGDTILVLEEDTDAEVEIYVDTREGLQRLVVNEVKLSEIAGRPTFKVTLGRWIS